jgi:hypothetical protein
MKQILLLPFLLLAQLSFSQITCTIKPGDTLICNGDSIAYIATVTGSGPFTYQWQKNKVDIPFAESDTLVIDSITVADTGYYRCVASNGTFTDTSVASHLTMYPKMNIDTLYRYNELGCPGTCKGQFKTHISGGLPPYDYNWGAGYSQDTIVFGLCEGDRVLRVTDLYGCVISKPYKVEVLKTPDVPITMVPPDTLYLYISNPILLASFPDTCEPKLTSWEWDFGEKPNARVPMLNPAEYIYYNTGNKYVQLFYTDTNGCKDSVGDTLHVRTVKLKIYNVITPNADEINDTWKIVIDDETLTQAQPGQERDYREAYISSEIVLYDRWGRKVFSATNYKSGDFDGGKLSDGVYVYVLKCHGFYGDETFKGSLTILGSGY